MTYSFNSTPLPNVAVVVAPLAGRIATADTPSRSGGYAGRRYSGTRGVTVTGVLTVGVGQSIDDAWSSLCAAHDVLVPSQLIIRDGWYLLALPENLSESDRSTASLSYEATYRAFSPYFLCTTPSAPAISTTGGSFTVGGSAPARPILTLLVNAVATGNAITVVNTTTGETLVLAPDAAGTWNIDCLAEAITLGGADRTDAMQGQYLSLAPNVSNTLSIACTGGASLSAASISFRARSV